MRAVRNDTAERGRSIVAAGRQRGGARAVIGDGSGSGERSDRLVEPAEIERRAGVRREGGGGREGIRDPGLERPGLDLSGARIGVGDREPQRAAAGLDEVAARTAVRNGGRVDDEPSSPPRLWDRRRA